MPIDMGRSHGRFHVGDRGIDLEIRSRRGNCGVLNTYAIAFQGDRQRHLEVDRSIAAGDDVERLHRELSLVVLLQDIPRQQGSKISSADVELLFTVTESKQSMRKVE